MLLGLKENQMITKMFGEKEITIRSLKEDDLQHVEKFQEYANSLVKEEARISINKELSLEEEREYLTGMLKGVKSQKGILLVAEHNGDVVGATNINLGVGGQEHVGNFGIAVRKDCRGIGLGKYLMGEVIKQAQTELIPSPSIIKLDVLEGNDPAISLYKSYGFKKVAEVPDQVRYKGELLSLIVMLLYLDKPKQLS